MRAFMTMHPPKVKMLAKGYMMVRNLKFNLMNIGRKEQLIVGIIAGLRLKNDLFP
jgi:hypothetical protein